MSLPPGPQTEILPGHTIPAGTRINDYRIDRVLGEGGFGIVYLATDVALERRVAIKEYLPSSMAARAGGGSLTVMVKSENHSETFSMGLRSFVNEAKLLAHFDHPALVKVHQFWEENGTAYMVMQYYEGPTLKQVLSKLGRLPTEAEVREWLMPLLDALEVLHHEHCYHRDIAPDNILLTDHGPLLLDFGAARRVIGDATHALTAVLKPGFAPIEQYGDMPDVSQGPWTDIFALASVLYAAISGTRPVPSVERLLNDRLRPLAEVAAGRCGHGFLTAVDAALALHPKDRPQSIAEFRALLTAEDTLPLDLTEPGALDETPSPGLDLDITRVEPLRPAAPPAPIAPPTPQAPAPRPATPEVAVPPPVAHPQAAHPAPPAASRRGLVVALAAGAVLAGGGWLALRGTSNPAAPPAAGPLPAEPASVAASAAPSPVIATPAPAPAPIPEPVASAPSPAPAPSPVSAPPPPASAPTRLRVTPPAPQPERQGSRCSDILQKASLEPLTASEAAYLKKECR